MAKMIGRTEYGCRCCNPMTKKIKRATKRRERRAWTREVRND